jgi:putative SOS response-associated peptidase YedK
MARRSASLASGRTGRSLLRANGFGLFAIITTDANELVADIHDRMPVILAPDDYGRWLGEEPDPRDLMRPFPAELMRMWPISTRVNKPEMTIPQSSSRSN